MWFCFKKTEKSLLFLRRQAYQGSASLMLMSLAFLSLLLTVNWSLSTLQQDLTSKGLEGTKSTSLETIADGALQEVLATRFYPASNRLNWQFNSPNDSALKPFSLKPFFKNSSFIFKENSPDLMARYQYVVIGGHPARQVGSIKRYIDSTTEAGYNQLIDPESTNIQTPFYVLLRTVACTNKQSLAMVPNRIVTTAQGQPTCGSSNITSGVIPNDDLVLKPYDLLAKVILNPSNATINPDKYQVVYAKQVDFGTNLLNPIELDDAILFPKKSSDSESASISTYGNAVQFAKYWATSLAIPSTQSASMANLERVLLESSGVQQNLQDVVGANITLSDVPDTTTKLHLYFRGPMDSRSFYQYQYNSVVDANGAINNTNKLNIQLTSGSSSLLEKAVFDFNYPSADHLTITLSKNFTCDQTYQLSFPTFPTTSSDLRGKIKDSYGVSATGTSTTTFRTVACQYNASSD